MNSKILPFEAYLEACENGYFKHLEKIVLNEPFYSYLFALNVPGANVSLLKGHMGVYLKKYHNDVTNNMNILDVYLEARKHGSFKDLENAVLKDPYYSYLFALNVLKVDKELLKKHMEVYLNLYNNDIINKLNPFEAYLKAKNDGYSKELESIASKDLIWLHNFARDIPGANIERLQNKVLQHPWPSLMFAKNIPGADINLLIKHMGKYLDVYCGYIVYEFIQKAIANSI